MKPYFENMSPLGNALKKGRLKRDAKSAEQLRLTENIIEQLKNNVEDAGFQKEKINQRGILTVERFHGTYMAQTTLGRFAKPEEVSPPVRRSILRYRPGDFCKRWLYHRNVKY